MRSNYNNIIKMIKNLCVEWELHFNLFVNAIKLQSNNIEFNSD